MCIQPICIRLFVFRALISEPPTLSKYVGHKAAMPNPSPADSIEDALQL